MLSFLKFDFHSFHALITETPKSFIKQGKYAGLLTYNAQEYE